MFERARLRLAALYVGLFALVVAVFSASVYLAFTTVLEPTFDIGPELSNEQAAEAAYKAALERVGGALLVGDLIVVLLIGLVAWVLAGRTLGPIREAHLRQRRFVADASHEMRTPLAAIRASAEGALASPASEADLRRSLAAIAGSVDRLSRLTNDLLLLARTDELPVARRQSGDLSVLVAEAVEAFEGAHPDLPRARLSLAPDVRVVVDADEVGRIVANLLDNAIRYGTRAPGSRCRITTAAADREATVEVSDDGPGIAAADLERIFEPFHRVLADAAGPDGTGLGLAIARGLAERNGGRLTVTSQPGAGATFRLTLPRHR